MSVWWILRTYEREPACRFCNRLVRFLSMRGCCNLVYLDDLGPFRDRVVMNGYTSWVPRRAFITLLRFGANVLLLRGWIQFPADRFRDLCYSAAFFFFSVCACVCETPLSPETCGVFFGAFALVVPFFVSTARSNMRLNLLMCGVSGNGYNLEVLLARAKPRTFIWLNLRFVIHVCRIRFLFPHDFDFVIII